MTKLFCLRFFGSVIVWLVLNGLGGQSYQLLISDADEEPLYGVLAIGSGGRLLGESDPAGQLLLPANLRQSDSLTLRLIGFATRSGTPASFGWRKDVPQRVQMESNARTLGVVAVVGRRNELARDLNYRIETVRAAEIERLQSGNSADALAALSGVYVQKSQFGGGSPVVRGLEANRVLLVVDGVRMNNAIFRSGHLQNAITVDVNSLERMEVIYGPGSLAYGSDALGGVIHFRTRRPKFRSGKAGWEIDGGFTYGSAADRMTTNAKLEYGAKNFASLTQLSFSRFGDLRAGRRRPDEHPEFGRRPFYLERIAGEDRLVANPNPDVQTPSGYRQYDLLQKLRFRSSSMVDWEVNFQASTSSDLPRYDALTEIRDGQLRWAEWNYGPQTRLLASLRQSDRRPTELWDVSNVLLSHQFIAEDRIQRRRDDPRRESSLVDVHSTNLQWDLSKALSENARLHYGFDGRLDYVDARTESLDLDTGGRVRNGLATRYPSDGSRLATLGGFAEYRHQLSTGLEASGGVRYGRQWMLADFGTDEPIEWPEEYLTGISNNEGAFTASIGLQYRQKTNRWRLLFAQGFRAPNVDDFAKFRERNGFIQVPNPELGSERSNSAELGYDYQDENWFVAFGIYFSRLNNAIIRTPFALPDGRDFFLSFGDTLRVQANVNAERANIYGFDVDVRRRFGAYWTWRSDFHWLRGRRKQADPRGGSLTLPQDHIPPAYGQSRLTHEREKWSAEAQIRFQFGKPVAEYAVANVGLDETGELVFDRLGTSDNLELTPFDPTGNAYTGSYGWWTLNLNGNYHLGDRFTLRLSLENIMDVHYRPFASGVSAPGRNLVIGVRYGR